MLQLLKSSVEPSYWNASQKKCASGRRFKRFGAKKNAKIKGVTEKY